MATPSPPSRVLQGDPPPSPPQDIRAVLLDLLRSDPEVRAALQALIQGEPDAALGTWIKTLIEETQRQTLRRDAFRRPA